MTFSSFQARYDDFQRQAVLAAVDDFRQKPRGRFLLVIPTGGGKTFTAVKSVNALFEGNVLASHDRVLWTAHRIELLDQAEETFRKFETQYPERKSFRQRVDFRMISQAVSHISESPSVRLVVIDEAHHGAANSYLPLFENPDIGVFGLTATPTRHDGKPLDFEKESYSIGFPDLVDIGVILRPEVRTVQGGAFDIVDLSSDDDLAALNTVGRNKRIVDALLTDVDAYRKVVVYVGTKGHAVDLCSFLQASVLAKHYESIAYIIGGENSRHEQRKEFLTREKKWKRSILVNVAILSEGYDDPTINAVIMAAPTRSKLVYMQAIGRAIRRDPDDELKKAYILEVIDELPNIRYRIDNRWLYSDVSDALEPAVVDIEYSTAADFVEKLESIYNAYHVEPSLRDIPNPRLDYRYGMLLFKVYLGDGEYTHQPLLIHNENRSLVLNFFNYLSERMPEYRDMQANRDATMHIVGATAISELSDQKIRARVFDAMLNCVRSEPHIAGSMPWITFIAFRLRRNPRELSSELEEFISTLINRDEVREAILRRQYPQDAVLLRFPLPLQSYVGRFLTIPEFAQVREIVEALKSIRASHGNVDHRRLVRDRLDDAVIPLEQNYAQSLLLIARDQIDYFRVIE